LDLFGDGRKAVVPVDLTNTLNAPPPPSPYRPDENAGDLPLPGLRALPNRRRCSPGCFFRPARLPPGSEPPQPTDLPTTGGSFGRPTKKQTTAGSPPHPWVPPKLSEARVSPIRPRENLVSPPAPTAGRFFPPGGGVRRKPRRFFSPVAHPNPALCGPLVWLNFFEVYWPQRVPRPPHPSPSPSRRSPGWGPAPACGAPEVGPCDQLWRPEVGPRTRPPPPPAPRPPNQLRQKPDCPRGFWSAN